MYEIFQNSKNYKYCLISQNITYYMKSFEETYRILSQAGIQLPTKIIKNKDEFNENNDFIPSQKPKIYKLHLRDRTVWNDEPLENLTSSESNKITEQENKTIYQEVEDNKLKYNNQNTKNLHAIYQQNEIENNKSDLNIKRSFTYNINKDLTKRIMSKGNIRNFR